MTTARDVVDEARGWIGTRWQHQGALRGVGADCVGLLVGVAHALGIADARDDMRDPALRGYGRIPNPALLTEAASRYLDATTECVLGGVVLMRFTAHPTHFAIVSSLQPISIVHAYAQARRVVEHRLDDLWVSRIVLTFSFRGVDG